MVQRTRWALSSVAALLSKARSEPTPWLAVLVMVKASPVDSLLPVWAELWTPCTVTALPCHCCDPPALRTGCCRYSRAQERLSRWAAVLTSALAKGAEKEVRDQEMEGPPSVAGVMEGNVRGMWAAPRAPRGTSSQAAEKSGPQTHDPKELDSAHN